MLNRTIQHGTNLPTSFRGGLTLTALLITSILMAACGETPTTTKDEAKWLRDFYKGDTSPIGESLKIHEIKADGHNVYVKVITSPADAQRFMEMDAGQQVRLYASMVCPNRNEKVWDMFDENEDIEIEMYTSFSDGFGSFGSSSCRMHQ